KSPCPGSCGRRQASPACCAIKAVTRTPPLVFGRSTIAARKASIPPILLQRSNYWMNRGIAGSRLQKQRRHTGNAGVLLALADQGDRVRLLLPVLARGCHRRYPPATEAIEG